MSGETIHRREFDLLTEMVEIIMTVPGGLLDQQSHMSWSARETLRAFAEYRTGGVAALGIDPLWSLTNIAPAPREEPKGEPE